MNPLRSPLAREKGMTLIELMITIGILGVVTLTVTTILLTTNKLQSRTVRRAEVQASSRQAMALMTTELRNAGADPSNPHVGIVGIVAADVNTVHTRADLSGDGVIQNTEPSEDVTYTYDSVAQTLSRNPGTGNAIVMSKVTNCAFTYFDAAGTQLTAVPLSAGDAARVHTIGVTLTSVDRDSQPITLTTSITLRNM